LKTYSIANMGRNILPADGISNLGLKRIEDRGLRDTLQFRADFFKLTKTLNLGIPEACTRPIPGSSMRNGRWRQSQGVSRHSLAQVEPGGIVTRPALSRSEQLTGFLILQQTASQ
jgi:hypothetical protein